MPGRTTARRALSRIAILREAVRFIDANGREQLTMRRLGAELGVEAMALYRYIPGREHLLDGVVGLLMDELYESTVPAEYVPTWQDYLQQMAHGVRTVAVTHPNIFPLVASRPPAAPWLRPPLRSLRWVEAFLEGLAHYGFSNDMSVVVYRSFSTFLLGHLLLEIAADDFSDDIDESLPSDADLGAFESRDLSQYSRVMALEPQLRVAGFEAEFEESLEDLIDRFEAALHSERQVVRSEAARRGVDRTTAGGTGQNGSELNGSERNWL